MLVRPRTARPYPQVSALRLRVAFLNISVARKPVYSHNKVRTSLKDRTLDSMFTVSNPSLVGTPISTTSRNKGKEREDAINVDQQMQPPSSTHLNFKTKEIKESSCSLTSVQNLRAALGKRKHRRLFFHNHCYLA